MKTLANVVGVVVLAAFGGPAWSQDNPGAVAPANAANDASTPAAAAAVKVLQDACLPLIKGGDLNSVAHRAGLTRKDGQWILPVAGKRQIALQPPDDVNPHVCSVVIVHRIGGQAAILQAVSAWAAAQTPPLAPVKIQEQSVGLTYRRTTSTWANQTPAGAEGLVLAGEKTLDGKPVDGANDQSELMISLTPA